MDREAIPAAVTARRSSQLENTMEHVFIFAAY